MRLIFIKIGGSLLAPKDKLYEINKESLKILAKQIKEVVVKFPNYRFILGNGAGSFGHSPAVDYKIKGKLEEKKQLFGAGFVHRKVIELNTIFAQYLQDQGLFSFQFPPGAFLLADKGRVIKVFFDGISNCLRAGVIPLVFGDVVPDKTLGFSIISTEVVFKALFEKALEKGFRVERVIFLGDYEGVYDKEGEIIKKINARGLPRLKEVLKGAEGKDVTGGMRHKVKKALEFARKGTKVNILGFSSVENRILESLKGKEIGTLVYK